MVLICLCLYFLNMCVVSICMCVFKCMDECVMAVFLTRLNACGWKKV